MSNGRIHLVNRFFCPDVSATSQIVSGIAFSLANRGYEIHVTTGRQLYEDAGAKLPTRETINGVNVSRVATSRFGRSGLVGRALDYVTFYWSVAWHLFKALRPGDIVVAKTDPPLLSVVLAPIARLRGATLVNWLQDVFPEVASRSRLGGRVGQILYRTVAPIRDWSLRLAHRNVVIGDKMRSFVMDRGVAEERITVISNWADASEISESDSRASALRSEWGWNKKFVVAYSGNLGRVHEIDTIIDAIEKIERSRAAGSGPEILFAFIGGGALRGYLQSEIARRGLTNVELKPYQAQDRLSMLLSAADVHLVSLLPDFEGLVVPSKVYGVMAAGRPVVFVGSEEGEIGQLVTMTGCGFTIGIGHSADLADAIERLADEPDLCKALGASARRAFDEAFTQQISALKWHTLLSELQFASSNTKLAVNRTPVGAAVADRQIQIGTLGQSVQDRDAATPSTSR